MEHAAQQLAAAIRESVRHVLRLLALRDRTTASGEIAALLQIDALSPSLRALLQGMASYVNGDEAASAAKLTAALELDSGNRYAHYWLAEMHSSGGRVPAAVASVKRALEIDPELAEGWFLYGGLALGQKEFNLAMHCLIKAIQCDIDNALYWHLLNEWLPRVQLHGPLPAGRPLVTEALQRQKVEFSTIHQAIYAVLKDTDKVQQLLAMAGAGTLHAQVQSGDAIRLLDDEFFLLVLQRTTLQHAPYERVLTGLRRALLDAIAGNAVPPSLRDIAIRFTSALAIYALTTEFVFFATAAETASLAACRQRLRSLPADDADLPLLIAITACYETLASKPHVAVFQALASPASNLPEFREMACLHILEPMKIQGHQAAVKSFGSINNKVSLAVRQQYEENPYPRWRFLGETQATTFDNRISRSLPHLTDNQQPRLQAVPDDPLDILIAGCGTGRHAVWCGREYPNTRILAVDLSSASLAYAGMKAEELGITNIDFRQGDILELEVLGRQFHIIESIGVLHHMEHPALGLAALARCLRPGGWMKIALYSHLARRAVRMARQRIADGGYPPTADGIRSFRHDIMSDDTDPMQASCERIRDFYSLSECRDLLFHVQEHQFTTQDLAELIATAGMEFMGFIDADMEFAAKAQPRISNWQSLGQWGEFESAHPDFFGSLYMMWLRKPGSPA